jgi:hypothetical protein
MINKICKINIMSNNKSFKISIKILISNLITLLRVHKRKNNSAIQINQIKTLKN